MEEDGFPPEKFQSQLVIVPSADVEALTKPTLFKGAHPLSGCEKAATGFL